MTHLKQVPGTFFRGGQEGGRGERAGGGGGADERIPEAAGQHDRRRQEQEQERKQEALKKMARNSNFETSRVLCTWLRSFLSYVVFFFRFYLFSLK